MQRAIGKWQRIIPRKDAKRQRSKEKSKGKNGKKTPKRLNGKTQRVISRKDAKRQRS